MSFVGCKAAFFCGTDILVYLRDEKPGLGWAGLWDLPGGGREGKETPEECLLRELDEEFGLRFAAERLIWRGEFPSMMDAARRSFFFGGRLSAAEVAAIRFGDEGQRWEMMPVPVFVAHGLAVPEMQRRAGIVWEALRV
ncbi:NUDIX hydrolase [Tabrizicola sp. BL-A-41-H6]|uniref:NUDIX hydrolase n=1 Tax=Tabrizicola sp. BL-A-41-H6 TaxID=3421107 RepID=UPI003D66B559